MTSELLFSRASQRNVGAEVRRSQLAHILRAASRIVPGEEILVIGSQAILGSLDEGRLPVAATVSREADVAFWNDADESKSDSLDGAIGELSQFDETFGYYGQGVSISTAVLPTGWQDRLVRFEHVDAGGAVAWCLERHDLALAKLAAQREKDTTFVAALVAAGVLDLAILLERLETLPVSGILRRRIRAFLDRHVS